MRMKVRTRRAYPGDRQLRRKLDSRFPALSYLFSVGPDAVATHVCGQAAGIESGKM
jgi:hypothetical protein